MTRSIYARAERCIACSACEVACQRLHGQVSNVALVRVQGRFAMPLMCRHCDPAPCVAACYTGALVGDGDGVSLDAGRCTGCGLCLAACPFGALGMTADARAVQKCDLCAARQAVGQEPACILTCPTQALTYDEPSEFLGRVHQRAAVEFLRAQEPRIRR